jgi:hypothetical protein
MIALAEHPCPRHRQRRQIGHQISRGIELPRLEEEHRIRVAHRLGEEVRRIARARRDDDRQTGKLKKCAVQRPAVLGAGARAHAVIRPDHQRQRVGPAARIMRECRLVQQLIKRHEQKIDELHLANRPHPYKRRADRRAYNRCFRNGCIAHTLRPEPLQQPCSDAESTAQDADVLAHDEHARVLLHQIEMRRTQRLLQGEGAHRTSEAA